MTEFEVNGQTYKARKMPVLPTQFHVGRRLTPFIGAMIKHLPADAMEVALTGERKINLEKINPLEMIEPIIEHIGKMSDADSEFIVNTCLEFCDRKIGKDTGWGPVKTPGGILQFEDIDMLSMLQIAWKVIQANFGNFFPAPSLTSNGETSQA